MKILYFSNIRWQDLKSRPQFTAGELAKQNNEVDYICRLQLGRKRDKKTQSPAELSIKNIFVLPLALKFRFIEFINQWIVKKTVKWHLYDIIIVTEPRLRKCLPENLRCPVVYDCMDRTAEFYSGHLRQYIEKEDCKLCASVDHIIISSDTLRKRIIQAYSISPSKITVIKNAVSNDYTTQLRSISKKSSYGENNFSMLYAGTIDFWFDWAPVIAFAQKHPEINISLLGPVKIPPPPVPENIIFRGPVPHEQILQLLVNAKILLLPFLKNELTACVDPIKLYEYAATGIPVISSYWEELDSFKNVENIHFYHNEKEFTALAEQLLASNDHPTPDIAFAEQNSWQKRGEQYQKVLLDTMKRVQK